MDKVIIRCVCALNRSATSNSLRPHRDYSPPDSSVHGIFQARTLEWVAISYAKWSSWPPRDWTRICLLHWQADYSWTPWEAQLGSEVIVKTIITTECSLMNCYEPESQFRTFICGLLLFNNFINKERGKYMEGIYLSDLCVAISKYICTTVRQASALTCHKCKTHTQTKKRLNGLIQSKLSSIWQQQAQYDVEERKANVMLAAVVVSQTQALWVLLNFGQIIPQLGYGVPF